MYEERRQPNFLEQMALSMATGAVTGTICAAAKAPDNMREQFTSVMIDLALKGQKKFMNRERKDYVGG